MRPNLQPKIYKSPVVAQQLYHMCATTRYNFVRLKATHKISPLEELVGGDLPPSSSQKLTGMIYAKQYEYDSKPGAQQLMWVQKVSAFHPFIFQKSGKSTIIGNLAVPRHFVAYLVFISSIRVDPGPRNTGPTSLLALWKIVRDLAQCKAMCTLEKDFGLL